MLARSLCPQEKAPNNPTTTGSISAATGASTASSASRQSPKAATTPRLSNISNAKKPKARPNEQPDEPTNANSPTASSEECGETNELTANQPNKPLDKGASDSPRRRRGSFRNEFGQRIPLDETGSWRLFAGADADPRRSGSHAEPGRSIQPIEKDGWRGI